MNNQQIFLKVVEILYELQLAKPLSGVAFNSYEDFDGIDPYTLYEVLLKLREDYNVIESISTSDLFVYPFDEDNPYPYIELDPSHNIWEVNLSKKFPKWAQKFLDRNKEGRRFSIRQMVFDTATGILKINGISIQIALDTNQYFVCKTLFNSSDLKNTSVDRLDVEDLTGSEISDIYQIGRRINEKLSQKLPVDDFILFNTKEIRINPKYL